MKQFKIRKSLVKDTPGFWELDFNYKNRRIRRKIKCASYLADLLSDLIEEAVDKDLTMEEITSLIDSDGLLYQDREFFIRETENLLFSNKENDPLSPSDIRNEFVDQFFPIEKDDITICLLGKAGVGKSTVIQKMSPYFGTDISFPFTDMSRTTTYSADYRFTNPTSSYKIVAALHSFEEIAYNIYECIDRAVSKFFELKLKGFDDEALYNDVLSSFTSDPNNTFDIRFAVGKFLKTTSPTYSKDNYHHMIGFWNDVYGMIRNMCDYVLGTSACVDDDPNFYNIVFAQDVRQESDDNPVYKNYNALVDTIKWKMEQNEKQIKERLSASSSFREFHFEDDGHYCLHCHINDLYSEDTKYLLQVLTSKKASQFGKSLINRIEYLRIELPYNENIRLPKKNMSIVMRDTIGVAHNPNESGGFEDSTNLNLEDVDTILILDDSRMNGDNNFSTLLEHILARVDASKIFFAYTFYDEFTKADFDEDDDLELQKVDYLTNVTKSAIHHSMTGVLFDQKKYDILISKLNTENSFFLKGITDKNDFNSINHMVDVLAKYVLTLNSDLGIYKLNDYEQLLIYDYKKIPLLYQRAIDSYYQQQADIYEKNPPHFKTTEALTRRLSWGMTYFIGARTLKPVDDFFDCIIKSLASYIDNPMYVNFSTRDNSRKIDSEEQILGEMKTTVTEYLRRNVNSRFLSKRAIEVWNRLYNLTGIGSDLSRRQGLIEEEHQIGSNVDSYLNSSDDSHMINLIEKTIKQSVDIIEDKYAPHEKSPLM